jgi:lipopolysaccharide transport system ATP-binding protein
MNPIEAQGLYKIYRLYDHPKDRIKELIFRKPHHVPFAALENVSFQVERGETFGIIGENGAGKSTLLKILAKTLTPSQGAVIMRGRVAALLELGAGFHPDFTGRENVYLNAALLGLSRKEIDKRFEEILSFSELGDFIDRPVRTYSTGMYVRLAFSIATAVDPDILVVDEALSVGDLHFQKKSINRLMNFRKLGKTMVFCSHNMYQVKSLCERAMWLKNGKVASIGDVERVIAAYETHLASLENREEGEAIGSKPENAQYGREIRIEKLEVLDGDGRPTNHLNTFDDLQIRFGVRGIAPSTTCRLGVVLVRSDRVTCFATGTHKGDPMKIKKDESRVMRLTFSNVPLLAGEYLLCAYILDEHSIQVYDLTEYTCPFFISFGGKELGISYLEHSWKEES